MSGVGETDGKMVYVYRSEPLDTPADVSSPINVIPSEEGKTYIFPDRKASYAGRLINWLNGTATGRLLQTTAFGAAGIGSGLLGISASVNAVAFVVFGLMSFITIAGIPAGVASLMLATGWTLIAYALFKFAVICAEGADENAKAMMSISRKENGIIPQEVV